MGFEIRGVGTGVKNKGSHHKAFGFYADTKKKSLEGFKQRTDMI